MTYDGNCRLGDLFESRREKGRSGLPLMSVTMNDGLVAREDLERRQDTTLAPEDHLLVKSGDIAYNMMRMWQGAFGLADREGLVSPAYVVVKPKPGIDPVYATYLLRTSRMRYLLWAYSYGLTDDRLRLYFADFARVPATVHSYAEQATIASILTTGDDLISAQTNLLENTKSAREGVLNRLLKPRTKEQRARWKEFELGDVAVRVRAQFDPTSAREQEWCIELEHIETRTGQLVGSTTTSSISSTKILFQPCDVLFGKLRPYLRKYWLAARGGVCSSEFWVLRPEATLCTPAFLSCLLQSEQVMRAVAASSGSKMPRAEWDHVERTVVRLPPLPVQARVTSKLEPFDRHIRKLGDYIVALRKEQRHLLLSLFAIKPVKVPRSGT